MRKFLISLVLLGLSVTGTSYGSDLESFLSKDQQFWRKGFKEFLEDAAENLKPVPVESAVAGKLKIFTEIAESYQIPAEELEKAYSVAVLNAAEKCLRGLESANGRNSDEDIAFLIGSLSDYVRFNYGSRIRNYAGNVAEEELKNAFKKCTSLRYSPMVRAFLKSEDCRKLFKEFPANVENIIYRNLKRREEELYRIPSLTKEPTLQYILGNLKKYDLGG